MVLKYPVVLTPDPNGSVIAEVPDVPGTMTVGRDAANALDWIRDALVTMLDGLMEDREAIPRPSRPAPGQPVVEVPPLVAMKLAVYQAMRAQGVTQAELAQRLHTDARQVRRLLDLYHASRLDQLEAALRLLGKRLVVDIRDEAVAA